LKDPKGCCGALGLVILHCVQDDGRAWEIGRIDSGKLRRLIGLMAEIWNGGDGWLPVVVFD
jgi:hypothetical protein